VLVADLGHGFDQPIALDFRRHGTGPRSSRSDGASEESRTAGCSLHQTSEHSRNQSGCRKRAPNPKRLIRRAGPHSQA
jgi:hypothetical protein